MTLSKEEILAELQRRVSQTSFFRFEPYPWQEAHYQAGNKFTELQIRAANRSGKSLGAAFQDAYHAGGLYDWPRKDGYVWKGRRFDKAPLMWIAGLTNEQTRDGIQTALIGPPKNPGTGMIPGKLILDIDWRQAGVKGVADTVYVKHKLTGGESIISFKSYDQGWQKFQQVAVDYIHLDEEPDDFKIYTECLTRLADTGGMIVNTFTPLKGTTKLVKHFDDGEKRGTMHITRATWNDAPHLSEKMKKVLADSYPDYELDARTKGIPMLGEGAIFKFPESLYVCPPVHIPDHWARICGIDFGIHEDHPAAAAWLAHDRDTDTIYVYDAYKRANETAAYHASALNNKGEWIPKAWPHDGINREKSGTPVKDTYIKAGAKNMMPMSARYNNDKGGKQDQWPVITEIQERIRTGRFKVFSTVREVLDEMAEYHHEGGVIVPKFDHALKSVFYAHMMLRFATIKQTVRYGSQYSQAIV